MLKPKIDLLPVCPLPHDLKLRYICNSWKGLQAIVQLYRQLKAPKWILNLNIQEMNLVLLASLSGL